MRIANVSLKWPLQPLAIAFVLLILTDAQALAGKDSKDNNKAFNLNL
jgi:hypothetical protein